MTDLIELELYFVPLHTIILYERGYVGSGTRFGETLLLWQNFKTFS